MNNINEEYCILYLTFVGFNYKLSNVKNYIKLNNLSKGLSLISSKKTISYGNSNIMYWSIKVNLNDNVDNYEKLKFIYDVLIEDELKNNNVPRIHIVTEDYSSNLESIPKDDYKKGDTKNLFLIKSNSHFKMLRRSN